MEIRYSKQAVKTINNMDKSTQQRVRQGLETIPGGDIKPLKGSSGDYRLRIGDWRILFSYDDNDMNSNIVKIKKIAPRGGVYKGG